VDIWTHCTDMISNVMIKTLEQNQGKREYNSVYLMVTRAPRNKPGPSARRRARPHAKPDGSIIEKPILSNFREGLSVPPL